jgi:phosphoenolpyruvate synthase/pyruvate phosphate dikinase
MFIKNANELKNKTIGGKGKGLYRLQKLGLNVPEFIVLPFESIHVHSLSKLNSFELSANDLADLEQTLKHWDFETKGVCIRSSIADEDGEKHAFSGIMRTHLNQRSLQAVIIAIKDCIASAFSEQAMAYRTVHGLSTEVKAAVIIQQQINSEMSGIMFTTNPRYPQELAIHSILGQGEAIVSGEISPDEFYFYKHNGKLYRKKIEKKELAYYLGKEGINAHSINSEENMESLNERLLSDLFRTGRIIEQSFACPQDIEFAISEQKIWYLQSRNITQQIEDLVVFDNSNIQESYSGLVSPLTFSFAQRAYATVYNQTMHTLQLPKSVIDDHKSTVENLLGLYKGRVYYNINNWYKGLQLLPSFKQNKADMERMMGLKEPVDFIQTTEKSMQNKLKLFPSLILNILKLGYAFTNLNKSIDTFCTNFSAYHTQFYKQLSDDLGIDSLWKEKLRLDANLLHNWSVPIINDFYVMMQNGKVYRKLKKQGIDSPESYLSKFKFGTNGIASYQQGLALQNIAERVSTISSIKARIMADDVSVHAAIEQHHPDLFQSILQFIHEYGDRTISELKLETLTMRTNISIFYKYLKIYLDDNINTPFTKTEENNDAPAFVNKLLKAINNRESLRLKRTHMFGMYREIYLRIARLMVNESYIDNQYDVFYLTEVEIEKFVSQKYSLKSIIEQRKAEWEAYAKMEVPDRVFFPEPVTEIIIEANDKINILRGEPCAGSIVTGEAIVVDSVSDNLNVKGKIIIAKRTDPGWIALFPSCLGVIIEKGSSLSHSVILLREMNKPSIINVPNLLHHIKTGDKIELNPISAEIKIYRNGED